MLKMINPVQHYDWGSKTAMTEIYGYPNPDNLPMAELWMGAHPKASSRVVEPNTGKDISLYELINRCPEKYLGEKVAQHFHRLPFLFKVLSAAQPLSIQVHPNKASAEAGFARENSENIPLDSPNRNYKDDNHKPELVYALTPFKAMNGFRPLDEICRLLEFVSPAHPGISIFTNQPDEEQLAILFTQLLTLSGSNKERALAVLKAAINSRQGEPWDTIKKMTAFYPEDVGLFTPLLLNIVELNPGQAMFLYARTPHAYLEGTALEVMANSDNVLRAGLTNKHIDVAELIDNLDFISKPVQSLLTLPITNVNQEYFPIPVEDFSFSVYHINNEPISIKNSSASIIFCIKGEVNLKTENNDLRVVSGDSTFVYAIEKTVKIDGDGIIAIVYNS